MTLKTHIYIYMYTLLTHIHSTSTNCRVDPQDIKQTVTQGSEQFQQMLAQ